MLSQGQGAALATTTAAGRRRQQSAQVSFHPCLASPHSGQARRASAAAMSLQRQQQLAATPSAAGLVRRPAHAALAPAGADGASDDEAGGFVLHMSQSYMRASQPAISPNTAAGLAAAHAAGDDADCGAGAGGGVEAPFTTPSQDSRVRSRVVSCLVKQHAWWGGAPRPLILLSVGVVIHGQQQQQQQPWRDAPH